MHLLVLITCLAMAPWGAAVMRLPLRARSEDGTGVGGPEHVVVLGPIDAGTHLLTATLENNFPLEMNHTCSPTRAGCAGLWKHSLGDVPVTRTLSNAFGANLREVAIIAVMRSPLSLAAEWRTDPWEMAECVDRPWGQWNEPCNANLAPSLAETHVGLNYSQDWHFIFKSTMHVYFEYFRMYRELKRSGLFHRVLLLRYEDVLLRPGAIVNLVGREFGWPSPQKFSLVESALKKSGSGGDRDEAVQNLMSKAYLKDVGDEGKKVICGALMAHGNRMRDSTFDVPEASDHVEGVDVAHPQDYAEDCV